MPGRERPVRRPLPQDAAECLAAASRRARLPNDGVESTGGTLRAVTATMVNANQIKPNAPVVCSEDGQFAVVDHMEGKHTIKLKKDEKGQHHYIPLSWVASVDDKVHVDRPGSQAMREWTTSPRAMATG
jgi:hypothetical protein